MLNLATSYSHDDLNVLALAVRCVLEEEEEASSEVPQQSGSKPQPRGAAASAQMQVVAALLKAGASPIQTMPASHNLPESVNGVRQPRYNRTPLGLALAGKVSWVLR